MLSLATKWLLSLSAAALVASFVYGVAANEGSGTVLLAFVSLGAFGLAAVSLRSGPDREPVPMAAGLTPDTAPAGGRPLFPSIWPLGVGLAVALLAVGAASSAVVIVPAVIACVLVGLGWLFQAWTEHPIFTARFGSRLSDRLLAPIGLPVAVFALVAIIALSLSRVLLAVSVTGSRIVAIAVAVVILGSAFFVVAQERMARAALSLLCAFALLAVLGAGAAGFAHGERTFEHKASAAGGPNITARDIISFSTDSLTFPAGQVVSLVFDNQTAGVPHNVGIFDRQGGSELFKGDLVIGPKQVTYNVPALKAGTYYFQCDVHNNMHGVLTVNPAGSAAVAAGVSPTAAAPTTAAPTTTLLVTSGYATTPTTVAGQ